MITVKPEHFYLFSSNFRKGIIENKKIKSYIHNGVIKLNGVHNNTICSKLCMMYNNKHFTMKEFCYHLLNKLLRTEENFLVNPWSWEIDKISEISKLFSEERLKQDQEFIIQVAQKTGIDSIEKYFKINSNGESIVFHYMKNDFVSPYFLMHYNDKFDNSEFEETDEHKRARKIIDAMEQVYKSKIII